LTSTPGKQSHFQTRPRGGGNQLRATDKVDDGNDDENDDEDGDE
jgi:hypothetical protein